MKKAFLLIGILFALFHLSAYVIETGSLENFLIRSEPACEYDNWVSHIAEGIASPNYNLYAPYDRQTNGFGNYVVPTNTDLITWGNIIDLFLDGMLEEAQFVIDSAGYPYQVVMFNDTNTRRQYYMLRETPNLAYTDDNGTADTYDDEIGAFHYGWGLYIYNPTASRPIIVTVPHPNDDFPTPIMGYDAFTLWEASYLMISGTGREVRWSNVGSYTNTKSISDPTRSESHPFNVAYKKFADKIRDDFEQIEFSFQVHSYDWNRHQGYTDNQISAGNNKLCPNLPIRDLSSLRQDIIHRGDHLMIPANTIGIHQDVYLNQYYSVNYSIHDFTFTDGEVEYPVNDMVDLPAYSLNRQMLYTLSGWNDYDSYEPFMHIEMDELPNMYEETENTYKWFYGWDEDARMWNIDNLYEYPRQYYGRWVQDLNSLFDDLFNMDDGMDPTTPENLSVLNNSMQYVTLQWDRSDSYDFDSYEILYSVNPIDEGEYSVFDRNNNSFLASQACTSINVTGLNSNYNYHFKIRARDKNDNYSELSNEVISAPAPASINSFSAHGLESSVRLAWNVTPSTGFAGFKVYRKNEESEWHIIDSYTDNPYLESGSYSYEYWDLNVENNEHYTYRISIFNNNEIESIHNVLASASPAIMHELVLTNHAGTLMDTANFAQNPYATDGQDQYWDTSKSNPSSNYVWVSFYEQYWSQNGIYLSQEVKGGYDPTLDMKTWVIRIRSDQLNVPLYLAVPTVLRSEKMYIYDNGTGNWHNCADGVYEFMVSSSSYRTMTLYWGNMQPTVNHGALQNKVIQGGNNVTFSWTAQYPFLIDHMNLFLRNATDSLMVYSNIPSTVSSYNYIVPQTLDMPETKVFLEMVATDGLRKEYVSSHTLAFVPRLNQIFTSPGWATKSNPFVMETFNIAQNFGDGSTGYIYDTEWIESDEFSFGPGYFMHATDYTVNASTSDVLGDAISIELEPGWNFVANPHVCAYNISSLRFYVNGTLYRFSEMIAQELISRAIYVYRNNSFELTNRIEPYEAFFIKSYANIGNSVSINFYPYNFGTNIIPPAPLWSITVNSSLSDNDQIVIGSNPIATSGHDFKLDLPKSPQRILFASTELYLDRSDNPEFIDPYLREEYRENFAFNGEEEMVFSYTLEASEAGTISFNFVLNGLPSEWTSKFSFNNSVLRTITDESQFEYYIDEAGVYHGEIVVYNHFVSNEDLVHSPIINVKAYPNPFNPTVNISFNLPSNQSCKVEVFNIRGQKVTTLYSGLLAKGNHQLQWNGKDYNNLNVASGVYFARIKTGNFSKNVKMMLMK